MGKPRLLSIDDAPEFQEVLKRILGDAYEIVATASSRSGIEMLRNSSFECVLLDLVLKDGEDGKSALAKINDIGSAPPVVMVTNERDATTAVDVLKGGAFDYIVKPPDRDRLVTTVRNAVDKCLREREIALLLEERRNRYHLVGPSPALKKVREIVERVAPSDLPVLITGESGTGKEIVANRIHWSSHRTGGKFVEINMASIPSELLESELFGHEKGSFTGAVSMKKGLFEVAEGGTIFLDEIGLATPSVQAKILHALEQKPIRRVGGTQDTVPNVRVIAATSRNLNEEIEEGRFLPDLYYRLNGLNIHIPPLRERPEDILSIAEHFLKVEAAKRQSRPKTLSTDARLALINYSWPGNVRQLSYVIESATLLSRNDELSDIDVLERLQTTGGDPIAQGCLSFKDARDAFERDYFSKALASNNYNVAATARMTGLDRAYLYKKIDSLGIHLRQM